MTAAAVALAAGVIGLSAVLAGRTRANAALADSNVELIRSQAADPMPEQHRRSPHRRWPCVRGGGCLRALARRPGGAGARKSLRR